ncbi:hypothetical protein BDN70DRAFT_895676 [Pholiota conissans]|uniref:Fanconi-associated nuclease n=1 Tax=Pholiota conissans TaxID=109636 RepID=A0A9P5Z2Y3_9AGAR|nr:hypothetical protein BDN70DRAFT_895676 [Pholiota conissans]
MATPIPKKLIQQLIYGGDVTSKESIEDDFEKRDEQRREGGYGHRKSAYVIVFEGMVTTVIDHEHGLLSEDEINFLERLSKLCYNTRYTLIRLLLRKANTWHAISSLEGFEKEIGKEGLSSSIADLCKPISLVLNEENSKPSIKTEEPPVKLEDGPEMIDLSMDSDGEDVKPNINDAFAKYWANKPSTSQRPSAPPVSAANAPIDALEALLKSNPGEMNLTFFCEDETTMTTDEILWKLHVPQLQQLVKKLKCKSKSNNKSDMIYALHNHASTQSVLNFNPDLSSKRKGKGKAPTDGLRQTQLPFLSAKRYTKKAENQQDRLREMALAALGKCIRVNFDLFRLVRRLHIIYYREIEHPTALLLPSLLTTFKKRHYAEYNTLRSTDIWTSREELLQYEKALEIEQLLLEILDPPPEKVVTRATKTPARVRDKFATPITPRKEGATSTSLKTPLKTPIKNEDSLPWGDEPLEDELAPEVRKEIKVKEHLEQWLLPQWQQHLAVRIAQDLGELADRSPGLARFETGHVYTRMVSKATNALGPLKEYKTELEVIEQILSQRYWSRGKRGKLYERRVIIHGHLTRGANNEEKEAWLSKAVEGLKEALIDSDTGIVMIHKVWRPSLMKRLMTLEKRLKIPLEERSTCAGELRQATHVELKATRVQALQLDTLGRPIKEKENDAAGGLHAFISVPKGSSDVKKTEQASTELSKRKSGQKSRWQGRNGQIVDVETVALEFYEDQGYKGFHSETRILTTLFGLLFWDIIFANIPGAFETAFQSAPLDMFEDSFYYARKSRIEARLEEIRAGSALEILQRHDGMYREKKTWCLCVSWDVCSKEELVEIVECMSGESLATICTLFCQDYRGRCSGGPDLFVWNHQKRTCKFVEVKGPGDIARENQKLWFDSLLRADVDVDLCKVIDKNAKSQQNPRKRKAGTPSAAIRRKKTAEVNNLSEEEDYDQLDRELEEDANPTFRASVSPSKRRRLHKVEYASSKHLDELPFASTSTACAPFSPTTAGNNKLFQLPQASANHEQS